LEREAKGSGGKGDPPSQKKKGIQRGSDSQETGGGGVGNTIDAKSEAFAQDVKRVKKGSA